MTAGNQKRATDLMRGWPALVRARGDARSFLGNVMNGYLLLLYAQQSGFHDVRGALVRMLRVDLHYARASRRRGRRPDVRGAR